MIFLCGYRCDRRSVCDRRRDEPWRATGPRSACHL